MKMPMISLRLPGVEIDLLDSLSEAKNITRSDLLRLYIIEGMEKDVKEIPDDGE